MREQLKDLSKEYDKSENDLKALQSVGQVCIYCLNLCPFCIFINNILFFLFVCLMLINFCLCHTQIHCHKFLKKKKKKEN